jgi:regulator of sigma E protease
MDLLHTLFYFLVAISVLVSFHEFGHFWVARKAGVKVLRFSVGFGKVLWSYQKNAGATEYVVSAIPLGGYVKMVDEREGEVSDADLPYAFNRQSLLVRIAVVAAGPVFNLVLAVALFWSVLVIGETGIKPILGEVEQGTLAASAGFVEGDEIVSVNDKATPIWIEAMTVLVSSALDGERSIKVAVKNIDGQEAVRMLTLTDKDSENPDVLYKRLGFKPWSPKLQPIIGKVLPDSAALAAGLKQGDLIVSADATPINHWMQWVTTVKSHPDVAIMLVIERDGVRLPVTITPKGAKVGSNTEGKVGASVYIPEALMKSMSVEYSLPPLAAIPVALQTTYYYSVTSLKMMGRMLIGKASVENLSGPISIAQYAGESATMGLTPFIKFMALVSVSLGVLNLLPIPVLDGGHLLFFAIEGIKGSPVSERAQVFFQQIGITILVSLMALVMFLDIERLF